VSARGIEDQITEEVIKQASDGKIKRFTEGSVSASKFLAPKVSQAINKSAKSARQCMEWFQECSLVFSKNNLSISWETPSGMFCLQDNRKVKGETVNFIHKGRRERITVNKPTKTVDAKKQKSSIAPNVVHSFDAAHLCMSVIEARNQGVQMFNMIHDSFACPASHTGVFNEVLRGEFVSLYDRDVLKDLYEYWLEQLPENQKVKLPPPPKQGDMDLALVKQSLYFFA
jgi:DNA-directed RNA polymerase